MKTCSKCTLPETHETILFNEKNVCNICVQQEIKNNNIDWNKKKIDLDEIIESHRGKYDYDCIVPFSGGKDSTWTLYYLVKEYKLKPLVVRFDHGFLRNQLEENTKKTFRKLGVDCINFSPNWKVVRKLMLQSLLEKGDFCWHCHTGIFSYPMQIAIRFNIPLIIWGEPSSEYTAYYTYEQEENVDEKRFNRQVNLGISADDMFIRLQGKVPKRDLKPFSYPPIDELKKINYRSICLGSYIPWDVKKQSQIICDELGWKGDEVENVPKQYFYEKIECYMQGMRDYIKYIKRGYSRATHLTSIDIRNGRMTREDALKVIRQYEGKRPPSLDIFLDLLGITEDEFYEICIGHAVSPFEFDKSKVVHGKKTHDYDTWCTEGKMSRQDALDQLSAFNENA